MVLILLKLSFEGNAVVHVLLSESLVLLIIVVLVHALLLDGLSLGLEAVAFFSNVGELLSHPVDFFAELSVSSLSLVQSDSLLVALVLVRGDLNRRLLGFELRGLHLADDLFLLVQLPLDLLDLLLDVLKLSLLVLKSDGVLEDVSLQSGVLRFLNRSHNTRLNGAS